MNSKKIKKSDLKEIKINLNIDKKDGENDLKNGEKNLNDGEKNLNDEKNKLKNDEKVYKSVCRICHGGCSVLLSVKEGKLVSVKPANDSPFNLGKMCIKGMCTPEMMYHENRILSPLKRTESNKWQKIDWDTALNEIAEKLDQIRKSSGPESIALGQGTGRHHYSHVIRFANSLGTPNWYEPGLANCFIPRITVSNFTYGGFVTADYFNTIPKTILFWGHNPLVSGPDGELSFPTQKALNSGSFGIAIDPRKTKTAKKCKMWLPIRPGTDAALALAMIHVIINEDIYDKSFVEKWTIGFNRLKTHVVEYTPQWAESITEIPAKDIIAVAKQYATNKPSVLEWGVAIEHSPNALQTIRAIALLRAITGNIDIPGSDILGMNLLRPYPVLSEQLSRQMINKRIGGKQFKLLGGARSFMPSAHLPGIFKAMRTGKPYPIRALLNFGSNPLVSVANSRQVYEALLNLDLLVVADMFMTPTASLANYVLPTAFWPEFDHILDLPLVASNAVIAQKKVTQTGLCRPDEEIMIDLAKRLDLANADETLKDLLNDQLAPLNMTFDELKKQSIYFPPHEYRKFEKNGFNTPSGKVEIYSKTLELMGYDPLPTYKEPPETHVSRPDMKRSFPYILTTGARRREFFHSEHRQIKSLRKLRPDPVAEMSPKTAKECGIKDGDWVYVRSIRGKIKMKASVIKGIKKDVVNVDHAWWFPEKKQSELFGVWDSNANLLTSDSPPYDQAFGTYQLTALLCALEKIDLDKSIEDEINHNIACILEKNQKRFPNKPALISEGRPYTYRELNNMCNQAANSFIALGISPGDRIALYQPNSAMFVIAYFAIQKIGAIAVTINPDLKSDEVKYILENSDARLLITTEMLRQSLEINNVGFLSHVLISEGEANEDIDLKKIISDASIKMNAIQRYPDDSAVLLYTSGTTGYPKGAILSHNNLMSNVSSFSETIHLDENDCLLFFLSIAHSYGQTSVFLPSFYVGATLVLHKEFKIDEIVKLIDNHGITSFFAVPPIYTLLYDKVSAAQMRSVVRYISGGGTLSKEISENWVKKFGVMINEEYGMTETSKICYNHVKQYKHGSVGSPLKGIEVKIVDKDARDTSFDEPGEIVIRGPNVTSGYWKNKKETEKAIQDAWFHTGDVGIIDKDGYIFIVDRIKDMINVGGQKVYPSEVEKVLCQHPSISDAAVYGKPESLLGEQVCTSIILEPNENISRKNIIDFCRQRLADYKIPVIIEFANSIPKGRTGKILRKKLRDAFNHSTDKVESQADQSTQKSTDTPVKPNKHQERNAFKSIRKWLIDWLSRELSVDSELIKNDRAFKEYGMNSALSVLLAHDLSEWLGSEVSPVSSWNYPTIESMTDYLTQHHAHKISGCSVQKIFDTHISADESDKESNDIHISESIAIIGMGCRFPKANNPDEFWKLLDNKTDAMSDIPKNRWDVEKFYDPKPGIPGKMYIRQGGFIDDVDRFDPLFFGISPLEASRTDPQQRFVLETCWESLEHASIHPDSLFNSETGVFVGSFWDDYSAMHLYANDPQQIDSHHTLSNLRGLTAGRPAYILGLQGPVVQLDTSCSSSLLAVHLACQSLRNNECNLALAGGVHLILSPQLLISLSQMKVLSSNGRCKTFDASADGFGLGEGCGIVVLKRLSDAQKNDDNILAILRGSAVNHDGPSNGLTSPNGIAQEAVIRKAMKNARIRQEDIQFVETHGTGTSLGDPIEIAALTNTMCKDRKSPLYIGSVKSNIGHLSSASGVASLIKVILSLKNKAILPNINYTTPNPHISWDDLPFVVPTQSFPWQVSENKKRMAGISGFGMTGTNVHMIIEEAPEKQISLSEIQSEKIFVLSAKTEEQLLVYANKIINFIELHSKSIYLDDLTYTLQIGRKEMEYRLAIVINTMAELHEKLTLYVQGEHNLNTFYQGSISHSGILSDLITEGQSGISFIKLLVEQKDFNKIAKLWVAGADIDWKKLYPSNLPKRIHLPTYPFAKELCWESYSTAQFPITNGILTESILHPLLHRNTSDFTEQRFSSTFMGNEFFLNDHVVRENKILPGVAYIEMARAAYENSVRTSENDRNGIILKNIAWARPFKVNDDPVETHIVLFPKTNGEVSFEVYSKNSYDDDQTQIHCQGIIESHIEDNQINIDINSIKSICNQKMITGEDCYQLFNKFGMAYGEGHKGIEKIYVGDDHAIARLELPSSLTNTLKDYFLHPCLSDAALQSSIGLTLELSKEILELPFALDQIEIYNQTSSSMWVYIKKVFQKNIQKFDIDLCHEDGILCARFKGFTLRAIGNDLQKTGLLMLKSSWKEAEVDHKNTSLSYEKHFIVLFENNKDVVKKIKNKQADIELILLDSKKKYIHQRFKNYALTIFEKIQSILKSKPKGKILFQICLSPQKDQQLLAGLSGLLKTARLENPDFIGQLICVDQRNINFSIFQDNRFHPEDINITYQNNNRFVEIFEKINSTFQNNNHPWKDSGIYLITGGAGAIGHIFARFIEAQAKNPVIILTGRSKLSEENKSQIVALRHSGATVQYRQVDVVQKKEIENLVNDIQKEFGILNGIIHAAGIILDSFIIKKTTDDFSNTIAPKVDGLFNLDIASKDIKLDFFVAFSSFAGVFGNIGQAGYACGNAFMDAFIQYRNDLVNANKRSGKTLSLNWPLWKDGGMKLDDETEKMLLNNSGITAMKTETGLDAFSQAINMNLTQVIPIEGNTYRKDYVEQLLEHLNKKFLHKDRTGTPEEIPTISKDMIKEDAKKYFKQLLSSVIKLPANRIDADAPLEKYGIDSLMVLKLTDQLEQKFGALSKTLFFEYQTISELTEYFIESYRDILVKEIHFKEKATDQKIDLPNKKSNEAALKSRSRFISAPINTFKTNAFENIAIIGLAGRYPMADNIHDYWKNLMDGRDCITEIPKDRWDFRLYFHPDKKAAGKTYGKWGGFINNVDKFDPLFFNISPREATLMDPQERLFLECVYETLDDAGHVRLPHESNFSTKTGVYVGVMNEEYQLYGAEQQAFGHNIALGGIPASIANRISYYFNFKGPCMTVDTMCSSSLTAIHLACQALKSGECNLAIAGGVNLSVHPNKYFALAQGQFLSSKGKCESFGLGGDGYVPGEGVGAILLKPLSEAINDKNHIYGIVKGSAINHGGKTNGFTVPNPNAQANVIVQALKNANVHPEHISYIEAHGTGTSLGDPIEITGLNKAFNEYTNSKGFCSIGSVKSNIGHCESAAGISGVTKVLLQMKYGKLVPSIHSEQLNASINFDNSPFIVQQKLTEWKPLLIHGKEIPRIAGISSFGAGGSNAHVIIEEYQHEQDSGIYHIENIPHIFILSAKNKDRLKAYAQKMADYIQQSDLHISNIAYTSQIGREAMETRLAMITDSKEDLCLKLQKFIVDDDLMEDIYIGDVRREKDALTVFESDEEFNQTIDRWITRGKYSKILSLWVKGLTFDWNRLYGDLKPYFVSLPSYPFIKERYWIDTNKQLTSTVRQVISDESDRPSDLMTFEEYWHEKSIQQSSDVSIKRIVCLITDIENCDSVASAFNKLLPDTQIIFLLHQHQDSDNLQSQYYVSRSDSKSYINALTSIIQKYVEIDAVLYFTGGLSAIDIRDYSDLVYLIQAINAVKLKSIRFLATAHLIEDSSNRCYPESWIGFERSLKIILPDVQFGSLYIESKRAKDILIDDWVQKIVQELNANKIESSLYMNNVRHVCQIRKTQIENEISKIKNKGTYLITGGCGGLGSLFANYLSEKYAVNLILTGRSPMDDRKRALIDAIENSGSEVLYIQADICDMVSMSKGLINAHNRFSKIDGVIHAAGIEMTSNIFEKDMKAFQQTLDPKVNGTLVIEEILHKNPPDFICYFSSSSAILGDFGACDYAVANRFLMSYAKDKNNRNINRTKYITINWPLWKDGGMGFDSDDNKHMYLKSSGQRLLNKQEGFLLFEQLISQKNTQHLVLAGESSKIERFLGLSNVKPLEPAAAVTTDTPLSIGKGRRKEMKGFTVEQCIEYDLKEHINEILNISTDQLDADVNFADFGFDSVTLAEFATVLSSFYEIEVTPSIFFGYATIEKLIMFFTEKHSDMIDNFYKAPESKTSTVSISRSVPEPIKPGKSIFIPKKASENIAEPIAIIGMSGRFSGARNIDEMWQILIDNKEVVTDIPLERFDLNQYLNSEKIDSARMGMLPGFDEFDPLFFSISHKEAYAMDPRQRILLQESWNALEDACYGPGQIKSNKMGIFVGVESGDFHTIANNDKGITSDHEGILASRLAYLLDFKGPVMAINTACSSGLVATHQASMSLNLRECDTAIVAGAHLTLTSESYLRLVNSGMLSSSGKCRAFDKQADGMVPGEAVVAIVLKRLSDAQKENNPIYAVIKGSAINYDGKTNGITAPDGNAQIDLLKSVYDQYKIDPERMGYIVTHGTGTKLGDPVEINALNDAFKNYTNKNAYCALTSPKTNFGHTMAASGLLSLVNLVKAIQHKKIPASINCTEENNYINWKTSPFFVNKACKTWKGLNGETLLGAVSAFGMSGTNAHMVIESYPEKNSAAYSLPDSFLFVFSAKSKNALKSKIQDILTFFNKNQLQSNDLYRISQTLSEGRHHFKYRNAIVVQDSENALHVLNQLNNNEKSPSIFYGEVAKGFSGQNAIRQYIDDMLEKVPTQRINNKKLQEIYCGLAELYCQGYDIRLSRLNDQELSSGIHLPTYPFVRDHFEVSGTIAYSSDRTKYQSLKTMIHPLLHVNTSDLTEQRFTSIFTGEEFFLTDHVVNGRKVLPGVAHLEMARAAVEQATDNFDTEKKGIMIKNVVWLSQVVVENNASEIHIGLFPNNEDVDFEIYADNDDTGQKILSQGSVERIKIDKIQALDIKTIKNTCNQKVLSHDNCYQSFEKRNLQYGQTFRGIEKIYVGEGQAIAKLNLPASILETEDDYVMHPGLLDSALQASIGLTMDNQDTILPFALEHIQILDKCSRSMWAYVRKSSNDLSQGNVVKFNIDLCDEQGKICARIMDFASRKISSDSKKAGTLMLRHAWKEAPIEISESHPSYEKHILALCEPDEQLQNHIKAKCTNAELFILQSKENDIDRRFEQYALQLFQKVQSLFTAFPKAKILFQIVVNNQTDKFLFSGLSGLLKTAHMENARFIGQLIELDRNIIDNTLLENNSHYPEDSHIKYESGDRLILRLEEMEVSQANQDLPLKDEGIYLISGGAGALGLIFANDMSKKMNNAVIILTGRSQIDEYKKEIIEKLNHSGSLVQYVQADVSKKADIEIVLNNIENKYGKLNGIIHSAGTIQDNVIVKKTTEEFTKVLSPKVSGLVNLDMASMNMPLDFFVIFSSNAGIFGNIGQCDYACANAFMDAYALFRNNLVNAKKRYGISLSINWPLWKEGGMKVDKETEKMMRHTSGMTAMSTKSGINAFYQGLLLSEVNLIVAEGILDRMKRQLFSSSKSRQPLKAESVKKLSSDSTVDQTLLLEKVKQSLLQSVSTLLRVPIEDLDAEAELNDYGFDSLSLTEFTNSINNRFGFELLPTVFFEYTNIHDFTQYLVNTHLDRLSEYFQVKMDSPRKVSLPEIKNNEPPPDIQDIEPAPVVTKRRKRFKSSVSNLTLEKTDKEPVAIVGVSCIFPMAFNKEEFWNNIAHGKHCIAEIPKDRWDWKALYGDPLREANKTNIKWGGFIDGVGDFDPIFFGISPKEAELMDPQQRLLMLYVWKVIEDAGYRAKDLAGTQTGMFIGTGSTGYSELISNANIAIEGYTSTGMVPSVGPNRMSYFLDIHGPSEPIETACSSSLVAIHHAVTAIESGSCDMAIAGGVNTMLTPGAHISFNKAGMLSKDGKCKTFSDQADGYVRGEGAGMLFLKKLDEARRENDHIYGIIRSTSVNHGGKANSLTAPNPKAQADVLKAAYRKAGVDPRTISYIETHGTGTELGDPIEIEALTSAFIDLYNETGDSNVTSAHCGLGSVKTNIGHLEYAAGVAGVIKVLMQLKHKTIAKSLHCSKINPYIKLDHSPFYISKEKHEWKPLPDSNGKSLPRRAGISSFGFGGTNAHVIIEEYIADDFDSQTTSEISNPHIIVLSAKSDQQLKKYAENMVSFFETNKANNLNLTDIAYTLQNGREEMEERLAITVNSIDELSHKLNSYVSGKTHIEDFYRGSTQNKDSLVVFDADEDLQKAIDTWIEKRKYRRLLALWVKGLIIDWDRLYTSTKPRRLSLPTYPFEKERYWVTQSDNIIDREFKENRLHPLLHRNTSDLSEQRFSSNFTGEEFFLSDHIVQGNKVLPAAAYLEMVRTAIQLADTSPEGKKGIVLKNVVWSSPVIVMDDKVELHISLFPSDNGEISYEIYSQLNENKKNIHSQGMGKSSDFDDVSMIDIQSLQAQCNSQILARDNCYQIFEKAGLEYGERHRGIEKIYVGKNQVLAKLSLSDSILTTQNDYILHPCLMDSAFQASIALDEELDNIEPALPFGLDHIEIIRQCTSSMWAHIRNDQDVINHNTIKKVDIDLYDDSGQILIRMKGLSSRYTAKKTSNNDFLMLTPAWKESTINTQGSELIYEKHTIVMSELDKNRLNSIPFEINKENIITLTSNEKEIHQIFYDYAIQAFQTIQSLLNEKTKGKKLFQIILSNHKDQQLLAGLSGLIKTARLENPTFIGQLIEIDNDTTLNTISKDNRWHPEDIHIKYEKGKRWVESFEAIESSPDNQQIPWKSNGIYLITGGSGKIGGIFAREIAEKVENPVIILTGRSPLDENKHALIKELRNDGTIIEYRQVDVTHQTEINELIQYITKELGTPNGIIHAAGIIQDNFIIKKNKLEFGQVIAPKVLGLAHIDLATQNIPLDFIVMFSSIAGVSGSIGQVDYACANAFMDVYARYRNSLLKSGKRFGKALSIDWPLWKDGGMQVDDTTVKRMKSDSGMSAMHTSNGIRSFYMGISLKDTFRLIPLEGNVDRLRQFFIRRQFDKKAKSHKKVNVISDKMLIEKAENYFKRLLSEVIKHPSHKIDANAPMEKYGIDSIMALQLTNQLEKKFGSLSKTLFYEYQTIRELTGFFIEFYWDSLVEEISDKVILQNNTIKNADKDHIHKKSNIQRTRFQSVDRQQTKDFSEHIAIIGLSGRFPMADDIDEFWTNLKNGKDCISEIPEERWNIDLYDATKDRPGKMHCKWGGFINDVDKFDPLFFNISPKEAELINPQERLFLETVWNLLEITGYTKKDLHQLYQGKVGVYVGSMYQQYHFFNPNITDKSLISLSSYHSIANRVSYFFNLMGPSIAIDTACSSSLTAIHFACESLQKGECALAIAGGVNLSVHPYKYMGLSNAKIIGSTSTSRSFGDGDGYIPSECVGAVLLKPLSQAVRDKDSILSIIKSSSVNHGGRTNGFTIPNPNAQADLIINNFIKSGIEAESISYVESAANGSALGDPIEISGLNKAFRQFTQKNNFCAIGSVKSNIGHAEAASGISQLTKIILQMQHKQLIPSIHTEPPNPNFTLDKTPFYINKELIEWKQPVISINGHEKQFPRRATISSIGATGANAHLIIEEYENNTYEYNDVEETYVFVFSAKSEDRLRLYASNMKAFLNNHLSDVEYSTSNIAYTLQTGRESMEYRLAIVANNKTELMDGLSAYLQSATGDNQFSIPVFTGNKENDYQDINNLFSGNIGDSLFQMLINEKNLEKIANYWVKGFDMPSWDSLYDVQNVKKIKLTTYPFNKRRCWVESAYDFKDVNEAQLIKDKTTDQEENIASVLKNMIGSLLKLSSDEIKINQQMIKYGFDSLAGMKLMNRIKDKFHTTITPEILIKHDTIEKLAQYLTEIIDISKTETNSEKYSENSINIDSLSDSQVNTLLNQQLNEANRDTNENVDIDELSDMEIDDLLNQFVE